MGIECSVILWVYRSFNHGVWEVVGIDEVSKEEIARRHRSGGDFHEAIDYKTHYMAVSKAQFTAGLTNS